MVGLPKQTLKTICNLLNLQRRPIHRKPIVNARALPQEAHPRHAHRYFVFSGQSIISYRLSNNWDSILCNFKNRLNLHMHLPEPIGITVLYIWKISSDKIAFTRRVVLESGRRISCVGYEHVFLLRPCQSVARLLRCFGQMIMVSIPRCGMEKWPALFKIRSFSFTLVLPRPRLLVTFRLRRWAVISCVQVTNGTIEVPTPTTPHGESADANEQSMT